MNTIGLSVNGILHTVVRIAALSTLLSACGAPDATSATSEEDSRDIPQFLGSDKADMPTGIRLVGDVSCTNDASNALSSSFEGWGWQSAHQYRLQAEAKTRYSFHFKINYASGGGAAIAVYDAATKERLALARTPSTSGTLSYSEDLTFTAKRDGELRIALYSTTQYAYGAYVFWTDCDTERECTTIASKTECDPEPNCEWNEWSNSCTWTSCERIHGPECDTTSYCHTETWSDPDLFGTLEHSRCASIYETCEDIPEEHLCNTQSNSLYMDCAWINGACAVSCHSRSLSSYRPKETCESMPECQWIVRDTPIFGVETEYCTER